MKNILLIPLLLLCLPGYAQKKDTMEVHFGLNDTRISKEISDKIDNLMYKDRLIHGQKLIVLGYADYLGDAAYNEVLSAARAKSVKDYLVSSGFNPQDITLCAGKGKIDRAPTGKDGYATDRKVQIIINNSATNAPATAKLKAAPVPAAPKPVEKDMTRLEANETMALNDILFEGGTANLLPSSYPELEKLATFMNTNNKVKIQIEGHICCMLDPDLTDDMGPDGKSPLSEKRARMIYLYLVKKGVYAARLKVVGLGNTKPLKDPELTDADREANRRVEIRILSK